MKKYIISSLAICLLCIFSFKAISQPISSTKADAHLNEGIEYYMDHQYDRAIIHFQQAIRFNPELADAYYYLADIFENLDEDNLAIENYKKAIELDISHIQALNKLALIYYKSGNYDAAIECTEKAI